MKKKVFYPFVLIGLTLACWLIARLYWGSLHLGEMLVLAILCCLFCVSLLMASRKVSAETRIYAGLLLLAVMFIPANMIVWVFPRRLESTPFGTNMALTLFLIFSLVMIIAAFLLYSALTLFRELRSVSAGDGGEPQSGQVATRCKAALASILCVLIIAKALHYLYWLMVWDTTYDGLGYIWLFVPVLAVLFAGVMLVFTLRGVTKLAAFMYLLLIPAMFTVSSYALRIDFRQLTEARAEDVNRAIENYHARTDRYPQALSQLSPRYLSLIPEPVIIFGQDWCYDGGEDYYRLGYVDREHWSAPHIIGQVYKSGGDVPDLPRVCEAEAAVLMKRYPDSFWTFGE
jgi:hypothetical protein